MSLEALDLRGEILARSARTSDHLFEIVKNGELLLRLDPDATRPRGQAVRRRLVETYLALGPMLPSSEPQYSSAETLAEELVVDAKEIDMRREEEKKKNKAPSGTKILLKAKPSATAADLRLHAQALERLGIVGDRDRLARAAAQYEEARALDPGDIAGADRLARLYQFNLKSPAKAAGVLDDLLAKAPAAPTFLAAARFYADRATEAVSSGRSAEAPADRERAEAT